MSDRKKSRNWKLNRPERERFIAFAGSSADLAKKYFEQNAAPKDEAAYRAAHERIYRRFHAVETSGTFTFETQEMVARLKEKSVDELRELIRSPKRARPKDEANQLLPAFAPWLHTVAEDCARLITRGVPHSDAGNPLRLASVYVNLETDSHNRKHSDEEDPRRRVWGEPERENRLPALEVLFGSAGKAAPDRTVLTGEPGSGKSTFFQYVTLCLADRLSGVAAGKSLLRDHQPPEPITNVALVPLRIILGEFHESLGASADGSAVDVLQHLKGELTRVGFSDAAEQLEALLKSGRALVLFDGLDEVPPARLASVRRTIQSFAGSAYGGCRIAVTCRVESYKRSEFRLAGFPEEHRIVPLSPALRDEFVDAWYRELEAVQPDYRGEGDECARTLKLAIRNDRLRDMAGNPFYLTAMAALHRPERPLPDKGAQLMDALVDAALRESTKLGANDRRDQRRTELAALLGEKDPDCRLLRQCLQLVAYRCRDERANPGSATVNEDILSHELGRYFALSRRQVTSLLHILKDRAGILQSRDGTVFEFAYRFEEFLAAVHLNNNDHWLEEVEDAPEFRERVLDFYQRHPDYARQVVVWAAGYSVYCQNEAGRVAQLIEELIPDTVSEEANSLMRVELAADIACDAGLESGLMGRLKSAKRAAGELRARLEEVRGNPGRFDPKTRSRAASAIGRLGDPRSGITFQGRLEDFAWVRIAGGAFEMGDDDLNERFRCDWIKQAFQMTRYPVTVAQYDAFLKADGYRMGEDIWGESGLRWRTDNKITGPENYDAIFQTPNHPRVGVSWHEAHAFCRWLSRELATPIRLPTEAEWERAARGAKARKFPWGDEDDWENRCSNWETGPRNTSAVGLFAANGDTPKEHGNDSGISDLAGNVWEWCQTVWREQAKSAAKTHGLDDDAQSGTRVLRGGSWFYVRPDYFRCAYRYHNDAGSRDYLIGFRCVRALVSARAVADS